MSKACFGLPINGLDTFEAERAPRDWNGFPVPLVSHPTAVQIALAVGDPIPMLYMGRQPYEGLCWELHNQTPAFDTIGRDVIDVLRAVGITATLEYPGWIAVRTAEGEWNFGTANGVWDGDLMSADGAEHLCSLRLDIDGQSTDAAMIAFAIFRALRGLWPEQAVRRG